MKKVLKIFLNYLYDLFVRLLNMICPIKLQNIISRQLDAIYSLRVRTLFAKVGQNLQANRSIHVWNGGGIYIGDNVHIFNNCQLATHPNSNFENPQIIIGHGCTLGEQTHITCANKITIGDNLLTGRRCTITDNSHGSSTLDDLLINPHARSILSKGDVYIGKNVWLGDNVVVLPGVNIGDGVIVGANAVVTKDIPSYSVAVGNPIKIVKSYSIINDSRHSSL